MAETDVKPFGAYLSDLLAGHNLSAAAVSRMLGHKSRTTLHRILQDRANIRSMEKFLSEFLTSGLLTLTPDEEEGLKNALEVSRMGPGLLQARAEMWNLVRPAAHAAAAQPLCLHDAQSGKSCPVEAFFDLLRGASHIRMLAVNLIPAPFFEELRRLLTDRPGRRLEIEHYFFLSEDVARTVRFITAIIPMLSLPCYSAYSIPLPPPGMPSCGALASSIVACRAEFPSGETAEYQLGFSDSIPGQLLRFPGGTGVCTFWEEMLSPGKAVRVPIRYACISPGNSDGRYLHLTDVYRTLEHNHDIYMLSSGPCLSLISPQILEKPFLESLSGCDGSPPPGQLRQLSELHGRRFHNIYHKKRVTHILMPLHSLQAFAETGVLPHPFVRLRPFTAAERRSILTLLRDQARDNPYFNIYFLKSDSAGITLEATCYDPVGILLRCSDPSETQTDSRAEALITLSEFTALFTRFFRETLLTQHALSSSASVSILTSLIDSLPVTHTACDTVSDCASCTDLL